MSPSRGRTGHGGASKERSSKKGGAPQARTRSSSRRRKITAEVEARSRREKDAFVLQQRLVAPDVGEALMDAAKQLLQAKDYQAVVEERAVEKMCGYPLCKAAAAGTSGSKKWKVNPKDREVYSMDDIGMFCSLDCWKTSTDFAACLDPDPAYCRPASAVAAARGAVAAANADHEASSAAPKTVSSSPEIAAKSVAARSQREAPDTNRESTGATAATCTPLEGVADCQRDTQKKALPKVRPRAVVRFSRADQSYTVNYADFDGGGALPGLATSADAHSSTSSALADKAPLATSTPVLMQQLLAAPIKERAAQQHVEEVAAQPCGEDGEVSSAPEPQAETELDAQIRGAEDPDEKVSVEVRATRTKNAGAVAKAKEVSFDASTKACNVEETREETDEEDLASECSSGDDFLQADVVVHAPTEIPFVRAWGVLSSWMTHEAFDVLHYGVPRPRPRNVEMEVEEETRPAHRGRRTLLPDLLHSRIPGELAFLAPRLQELTRWIGVHQALPSVAESSLYDLLAALLLRALLRTEHVRGRGTPTPENEAHVARLVDGAARRFLGGTEEERKSHVAVLDELLLPRKSASR